MQNYLIRNITVVNDGRSTVMDVLIKNGRIEKLSPSIQTRIPVKEINGEKKHLLPGAIDDQVHFREPGLTYKGSIYTESKAAVAGGVTSFMEMPNTVPPVFTHELLEQKYQLANESSLANYSFYMGTSNDNSDEALRTNKKLNDVCGIKIFMGSSTGGLLVDNYLSLDKIFRESELLIATHCEDERIIKKNLEQIRKEKDILQPCDHPKIRDVNCCFESSLAAIGFAKKYGSRLHILHISTAKELSLFSNFLPLNKKRITAEVCVHHLHFTSEDYERLGNLIKCNPAIKEAGNREGLWKAVLDDTVDVIASDHAPHTFEEKNQAYEKAHAGLPLVQHALPLMLYYVRKGSITLEKLVEKLSHSVANCFQVAERGFIREGYFADLVIADLEQNETVTKKNILYKCGWSPFDGFNFPASITHTFVNGHLVFENGSWNESVKGQRLKFERS